MIALSGTIDYAAVFFEVIHAASLNLLDQPAFRQSHRGLALYLPNLVTSLPAPVGLRTKVVNIKGEVSNV
jgi:hypothetical protein